MAQKLTASITICLVLAILLGGCEFGSGVEQSTYFDDKEKQLQFVFKLDQAGVQYRVDGNDVWYHASDNDKIKNIKLEMSPELAYLGHTAIYYERKFAERFMYLLAKANIQSELFVRNGEYLVGWQKKDDHIVRRIYAKFKPWGKGATEKN